MMNEVILLSRCVIISAFQSAAVKENFDFRQNDFIICADGGYIHAKTAEILPDVVIGDFDSVDFEYMADDLYRSGRNSSRHIVRVASEKDDTDTMICLKYGIEQGFSDFYVIGGLGGRLDHTVANLQTMSYAADQGKSIWFLDGNNKATLRNPGFLILPKLDGYRISLFAFGDCCEGVSIRGVKYPLTASLLSNNFPLGVSNEFSDCEAEISHEAGKLLVILSHD